MKARGKVNDDLRDLARPLVETFVHELVEVLAAHVADEQARIVGRITEQLAGYMAPEQKRRPPAKHAKLEKRTKRDTKPGNVIRRPTCGKCGKPGHNARTCPGDEVKAEKPTPAIAVVDMRKPPPQVASPIPRGGNTRLDRSGSPRGAPRPVRADAQPEARMTPTTPNPANGARRNGVDRFALIEARASARRDA